VISRPGASTVQTRATLLQVADTARILRVSTYSLILLAVWQLLHQGGDAALATGLFLVARKPFCWSYKVLNRQGHSRLEITCVRQAQSAHLRHDSRNAAPVLLSAALSPFGPDTGWDFLMKRFDNRRIIYSHDYTLNITTVYFLNLCRSLSCVPQCTGDLYSPTVHSRA